MKGGDPLGGLDIILTDLRVEIIHMALTKRIIPCLDIKDGRTVKGVNFENIRDAGDPVELGALYARQGADELVFLDITATHEKRKTLSALVDRISRHINIPFTVGGGISSVGDVQYLLQCGADKISVNTAAFRRPELLGELALGFWVSQCVVLAIDTRRERRRGMVCMHSTGGRIEDRHPLRGLGQAGRGQGSGGNPPDLDEPRRHQTGVCPGHYPYRLSDALAGPRHRFRGRGTTCSFPGRGIRVPRDTPPLLRNPGSQHFSL